MAAESRASVVREDDGVAVVVLKNPPVNALSRALLSDLDQRLRELADDASVRAVVLGGDGANFCAGADLKELATIGPADAPAMLEEAQRTLRRLEELAAPTVVALHGMALGGGLELALAGDLRVADDSAKLGAPEVSHGLMPAYGGTQRLPRLVGVAKAKELIFTGSLVPANEALRIGLVNKVVGGGQELRAARDIAHTIGQRAPRAVRAAKRALRTALETPLADGLRRESELFLTEVAPSADLVEGIRAFSERRPPKFQGT